MALYVNITIPYVEVNDWGISIQGTLYEKLLSHPQRSNPANTPELLAMYIFPNWLAIKMTQNLWYTHFMGWVYSKLHVTHCHYIQRCFITFHFEISDNGWDKTGDLLNTGPVHQPQAQHRNSCFYISTYITLVVTLYLKGASHMKFPKHHTCQAGIRTSDSRQYNICIIND